MKPRKAIRHLLAMSKSWKGKSYDGKAQQTQRLASAGQNCPFRQEDLCTQRPWASSSTAWKEIGGLCVKLLFVMSCSSLGWYIRVDPSSKVLLLLRAERSSRGEVKAARARISARHTVACQSWEKVIKRSSLKKLVTINKISLYMNLLSLFPHSCTFYTLQTTFTCETYCIKS